MAPDYVSLTTLQKLEVFQYALDKTTGQDLYRVHWLTSENSEAWLRASDDLHAFARCKQHGGAYHGFG